MARNGSGTYVLPAGQPVVSGTTISSTTHNTLITDIGNEITKSICTDGQTPMTANLPMGNNKITGLAAGAAASDAVRFDQVSGLFIPLAGGTATGKVTIDTTALGFGTSFDLKNTASTPQMSWTGTAGGKTVRLNANVLEWLNNAYTNVIMGLTDVGSLSIKNTLAMENGMAITMKDTAATARIMHQLTNTNVVQFGSAGGGYEWYSSAPGIIATLTNAGAFSAVTVTQTSDERKKCNWKPLTDAQLDALADMQRAGTFDWADGSGPSVGGSAQEIQAIIPEAVHVAEDGSLSVNYGGLNFAILQAMLRRQKVSV